MAIHGINYEKCVDCGKCYDICPMDCFGIFAGKVYVKYPQDCESCFLCNMVCETRACLIDVERAQPISTPQRI